MAQFGYVRSGSHGTGNPLLADGSPKRHVNPQKALCGREIFDGILAKAAMKLFVGVTNNDWFRFLAERNPEEVNFWRPRSQNDFKALKSGDIFLFKLHAPLDFIAGGGIFLRHIFLPLPFAWQTFGVNNGVPNFESFERSIL